MSKEEKRDFDAAAAAWDEKPARLALAADIAAAMFRSLSLDARVKALDFGCGTGLLTLALAPKVGSITGADSSRGMLAVLEEKVRAGKHSNVRTLFLNPEADVSLGGPYDLVTTAMTMHHIPDVPAQLEAFHACLAPGGALCVADLDSDGGLFHDDPKGVFHEGFDREVMAKMFAEAGFADIARATAAEVVRPGADGVVRSFSVFMVTGRKQV